MESVGVETFWTMVSLLNVTQTQHGVLAVHNGECVEYRMTIATVMAVQIIEKKTPTQLKVLLQVMPHF